MRTFREQLTVLGIDNVSGIVYSADQLSIPHQGRQVYYGCTPKPHSHSAVYDMFQNDVLGIILPFTQWCVRVIAGTQTRLRKHFNMRSIHSGLRKGILNSLVMRMFNSLKEKQYGKN